MKMYNIAMAYIEALCIPQICLTELDAWTNEALSVYSPAFDG